jgi:GT2 family glycosyltransferase
MKFSVIIPVRNRPAAIRRAVEAVAASLRASDLAAVECEILVVDNASTDATAREASEAGARVIGEPVANRCRARNRGAEAARGEWLLFIDSDCEPLRNWLPEMARAVASAGAEVGAIGGKVIDGPATTPVEAYIAARGWFDQEKYLSRPGAPGEPRFALMANLAVRREAWRAVGGLDAALIHAAEDADFCLRLEQVGWQLAYAPDAGVIHHHRATILDLWRQSVGWGAGQAELFAKWHREWEMRIWIDVRLSVWAVKGLLKTPWRWITGRTPLERREPWLDCIANTGLMWGRFSRGLALRKIVL